jgi:hypothetical protein
VEWQQRLRTPVGALLDGESTRLDSRRACAMRGEWLRSGLALVDRTSAREFIERHWLESQRQRILTDRLNLYQDHASNPESHAMEAAGRAALLELVESGYDGNSAAEMRRAVEGGTAAALLMVDPSGQCPANGWADGHVLSDALYLLAFDLMAERSATRGDTWLAGQYRRAAMMSFRGIRRWERGDGSFFVTKNRFEPAARVGYQPGGTLTAANAALMYHLGEAFLARRTEIAECPTPVEIGGYALAADPAFASVFASAAGMQMMANLRGDPAGPYGVSWTALGVVRFSRPGWDARLGPSDGVHDAATGRGVSFAPTWMEGGRWTRLADVPERYQGRLSVAFAHPLLVRCAIDWFPLAGRRGPSFRQEFVLTPDGILATLEAPATVQAGVTWPLLENDGEALEVHVSTHTASVRYPGGADEQNFISLASTPLMSAGEDAVRGSYGWLRPVQARTNLTFVYPRGAQDPPASAVRASFRQTVQGFSTVLGRVAGNLYVGRNAAGGEGKSIDLDGDGRPEAAFSAACGFLLQLSGSRVMAVEVDRDVRATIKGRRLSLKAFEPVLL